MDYTHAERNKDPRKYHQHFYMIWGLQEAGASLSAAVMSFFDQGSACDEVKDHAVTTL